jgi:hypothetical protein
MPVPADQTTLTLLNTAGRVVTTLFMTTHDAHMEQGMVLGLLLDDVTTMQRNNTNLFRGVGKCQRTVIAGGYSNSVGGKNRSSTISLSKGSTCR